MSRIARIASLMGRFALPTKTVGRLPVPASASGLSSTSLGQLARSFQHISYAGLERSPL